MVWCVVGARLPKTVFQMSLDGIHKPFDMEKSCSTSGRHPGTV